MIEEMIDEQLLILAPKLSERGVWRQKYDQWIAVKRSVINNIFVNLTSIAWAHGLVSELLVNEQKELKYFNEVLQEESVDNKIYSESFGKNTIAFQLTEHQIKVTEIKIDRLKKILQEL